MVTLLPWRKHRSTGIIQDRHDNAEEQRGTNCTLLDFKVFVICNALDFLVSCGICISYSRKCGIAFWH